MGLHDVEFASSISTEVESSAMADKNAQFIDVSELRVGHYIYLDVGWMGHPFALNNFRVATEDQIATIRSLGIERLRYAPELSVFPEDTQESSAALEAPGSTSPARRAAQEDEDPSIAHRRAMLSDQRARLQRCENSFNDTVRDYRQMLEQVFAQPELARNKAESAVDAMLSHMGSTDEETLVRLLSEKAGERSSLHAINVAIISLLLGKALGCDADQMREIGIGGLLHDIGKVELPDRLRWGDANLTAAESALYREHVSKGAALARKMKLSPATQLIVAQHHEFANGRGFPLRLSGEQIAMPARVVSLVNVYDNLCNPSNPSLAVTPHEALSLIYAQQKSNYDTRTLAAFVRLMGVYPPGSVIELNDGHFAMVVSVNSARPLRPQIIVHDTRVKASEALIVDLAECPEIGIRRSLKPQQLPKASFDYLSPRRRLCYFFERAVETGSDPTLVAP